MDDPRDFTRRLLAQIGQRQGQPLDGKKPPALPYHASSTIGALPADGLLVVADSTCPNAAPLVREALSLRRFGIEVTVFADKALADWLGRGLSPVCLRIADGHFDGKDLGSAGHLLAASGSGQMAKLSLGLRDTVAADVTLCALWNGLTVYTDLDYASKDEEGRPCQNAAVAALYQGHEKKLRAMGILHLAKGEVLTVLLPRLRQTADPDTGSVAAAPSSKDGRVFITRRDVTAYDGPSEWTLPADAVVTAEAKDEMARRKLTLRRQGRQ